MPIPNLQLVSVSGGNALAKQRTSFVCQNCAYESPKWMGRCPDCGSWNSMVEEKRQPEKEKESAFSTTRLGGTAPVPVDSVESDSGERLPTGMPELDRVLGGGIVKGSLVLIGGDPGVGKSTLLLQVSRNLALLGQKVLYVSGEESAPQTKMRARRIGALSSNLLVAAETSLEQIEEHIRSERPALCIIDSIQTVHAALLESAPGSVGQVRESANRCLTIAKGLDIPIFLVGHMTKSGAIAGPRVLEHVVDTVLYFEGDRSLSFRVLRAIKNRFGSTNEIGVFEMDESGLVEVPNPSEIFLSGRPQGVSGSAVAVCIEGTRPLLVEVQSLVATSTFGMPRRVASGIDHSRLGLLLAVLERRSGMQFGNMDVYLKIAGGLRIDEPALDLAAAIAAASALRDCPVKQNTAFVGEIGLGGEIRAVSRLSQRLSEVARMGFQCCIVPASNQKRLEKETPGLAIRGVSNLSEAIGEALL